MRVSGEGVWYLVFATHEVRPGKLLLLSQDEGRQISGDTDAVGVLPVTSVEFPGTGVVDGLCDGITIFKDSNEGFDRHEVGALENVKYGVGKNFHVGCEVYMLGYSFGENLFVDVVEGENRSLPFLRRGIVSGWVEGGSQFLIDMGNMSGFSGGPVCYRDGDTWYVFGVLSGMVVEAGTRRCDGFSVAMNLECAFDVFDYYSGRKKSE